MGCLEARFFVGPGARVLSQCKVPAETPAPSAAGRAPAQGLPATLLPPPLRLQRSWSGCSGFPT